MRTPKTSKDHEPKSALEVARRCLCLELLSQRAILESETGEDPQALEAARKIWASRWSDLGIAETLTDGERELLERPVGSLSEDDMDDVDGRASGAVVLLWALGRLGRRPTFADVRELETVLAEHGLLGDGSISQARAAAESAALRPDSELEDAWRLYDRVRGKAKELADPEKIVAALACHHIDWIRGHESEA